MLWARFTMGESHNISSVAGVELFADHRLVTTGPFAVVRHPMYLGFAVAAVGSLALYRTWAIAFVAVHGLIFIFRARREEQALAARFGDDWADYCRRVPAIVPWPRRAANERAQAREERSQMDPDSQDEGALPERGARKERHEQSDHRRRAEQDAAVGGDARLGLLRLRRDRAADRLLTNPAEVSAAIAQRHGLSADLGVAILPAVALLGLAIAYGLYTLSRWGMVLTVVYLAYFAAVSLHAGALSWSASGQSLEPIALGNLTWSAIVIVYLFFNRERYRISSRTPVRHLSGA